MKITKISLYDYEWVNTEPEGYQLSGGRGADTVPGRVLRIDTDEGITGWGEGSPWGGMYLEMFVGAVKPGIEFLAPAVMGMDPTHIGHINHIMDNTLLGHGYIKHLIDMACWDILGKATGRPLYELLGGMLTEKVHVAPFIRRKYGDHQKELLKEYRRVGVKHFGTKAVGDLGYTIEYINYVSDLLEPGEFVIMDVNRGWRLEEALLIANACRESGQFYLEQPCETYEECRDVMHMTGVPILLCECMVTSKQLARAAVEGGIGGLNIKIARVGGITKAKLMRDMCAEWNIQVWMHTVNVSQIGDAAAAHLAHSTPPHVIRNVMNSTHSLTSTVIAEGVPEVVDNVIVTSDRPSLGVTPIPEALGEPIGVWS